MIKWGVYTLALLPVWFLEAFVLPRYPLFGVSPMLLPLAVVVVGVPEGAAGGAGFGVGVGALCSAVYTGSDGLIWLGLCLIGLGCGALSQYVLRRDLLGCFLCALLGLCQIGRAHV